MALTVEDGSVVASAESYATVAQADTYHAAFGNADWALLETAEKEQALRKATLFLTQMYSMSWKGSRYSEDQVLDWPRDGVVVHGFTVDYDEVPTEVVNACIILALKASSAELLPDTTQQVIKKKIGPIETTWDHYSKKNKQYEGIKRMLAPFLATFGNTMEIVRA